MKITGKDIQYYKPSHPALLEVAYQVLSRNCWYPVQDAEDFTLNGNQFMLTYKGFNAHVDYNSSGNCQIMLMCYANNWISSIHAPIILHALMAPGHSGPIRKLLAKDTKSTGGDCTYSDNQWLRPKAMLMFDVNQNYGSYVEKYFPKQVVKTPYRSTNGSNMVLYLVETKHIENIKI